MSHKISILVRADVDSEVVTILVTGCLTGATREVLACQIERARLLDPASPLVVDARDAQHVDPIALQLLRSRVDNPADQDTRWHRSVPVRFLVPSPLPRCPLDDPTTAA
ncbi:hypothetical protein [Brachybacterium subflavum]|uniref:hypothetical protein n=1 Tax=Brachybacterium subflavum TaxID=2585206 RepID=UPI00126642BB|nr:hypothetical protein [Brachybacterium subflavum]